MNKERTEELFEYIRTKEREKFEKEKAKEQEKIGGFFDYANKRIDLSVKKGLAKVKSLVGEGPNEYQQELFRERQQRIDEYISERGPISNAALSLFDGFLDNISDPVQIGENVLTALSGGASKTATVISNIAINVADYLSDQFIVFGKKEFDKGDAANVAMISAIGGFFGGVEAKYSSKLGKDLMGNDIGGKPYKYNPLIEKPQELTGEITETKNFIKPNERKGGIRVKTNKLPYSNEYLEKKANTVFDEFIEKGQKYNEAGYSFYNKEMLQEVSNRLETKRNMSTNGYNIDDVKNVMGAFYKEASNYYDEIMANSYGAVNKADKNGFKLQMHTLESTVKLYQKQGRDIEIDRIDNLINSLIDSDDLESGLNTLSNETAEKFKNIANFKRMSDKQKVKILGEVIEDDVFDDIAKGKTANNFEKGIYNILTDDGRKEISVSQRLDKQVFLEKLAKGENALKNNLTDDLTEVIESVKGFGENVYVDSEKAKRYGLKEGFYNLKEEPKLIKVMWHDLSNTTDKALKFNERGGTLGASEPLEKFIYNWQNMSKEDRMFIINQKESVKDYKFNYKKVQNQVKQDIGNLKNEYDIKVKDFEKSKQFNLKDLRIAYNQEVKKIKEDFKKNKVDIAGKTNTEIKKEYLLKIKETNKKYNEVVKEYRKNWKFERENLAIDKRVKNEKIETIRNNVKKQMSEVQEKEYPGLTEKEIKRNIKENFQKIRKQASEEIKKERNDYNNKVAEYKKNKELSLSNVKSAYKNETKELNKRFNKEIVDIGRKTDSQVSKEYRNKVTDVYNKFLGTLEEYKKNNNFQKELLAQDKNLMQEQITDIKKKAKDELFKIKNTNYANKAKVSEIKKQALDNVVNSIKETGVRRKNEEIIAQVLGDRIDEKSGFNLVLKELNDIARNDISKNTNANIEKLTSIRKIAGSDLGSLIKERIGVIENLSAVKQFEPTYYSDFTTSQKLAYNAKNLIYYYFLAPLKGTFEVASNQYRINKAMNSMGFKTRYKFTQGVRDMAKVAKANFFGTQEKLNALLATEKNPYIRAAIEEMIEFKRNREIIFGDGNYFKKALTKGADLVANSQTTSEGQRAMGASITMLRALLNESVNNDSRYLKAILNTHGVTQQEAEALILNVRKVVKDGNSFMAWLADSTVKNAEEAKTKRIITDLINLAGKEFSPMNKVFSKEETAFQSFYKDSLYMLKRYGLSMAEDLFDGVTKYYDENGILRKRFSLKKDVKGSIAENLFKTSGDKFEHAKNFLITGTLTYLSKQAYNYSRDKILGGYQDEMVEAKIEAVTRGDIIPQIIESVYKGSVEMTGMDFLVGGDNIFNSLFKAKKNSIEKIWDKKKMNPVEKIIHSAASLALPMSFSRAYDYRVIKTKVPNSLNSFSEKANNIWKGRYKKEAEREQRGGDNLFGNMLALGGLLYDNTIGEYFNKNPKKAYEAINYDESELKKDEAILMATGATELATQSMVNEYIDDVFAMEDSEIINKALKEQKLDYKTQYSKLDDKYIYELEDIFIFNENIDPYEVMKAITDLTMATDKEKFLDSLIDDDDKIAFEKHKELIKENQGIWEPVNEDSGNIEDYIFYLKNARNNLYQ